MNPLPITPETKVGELLDAFPEAEDILIAIAPKFKALKNPLLRRTVAKVATLEQAARVADMPVNQLVRALREAVGQDVGEMTVEDRTEKTQGGAPAWTVGRPKHRLDADALLARGTTPVARVAELLAGMEAGEVVLVKSTFQVAPLIDAMRVKGHEVFTRKVGGEDWEAWIKKQ